MFLPDRIKANSSNQPRLRKWTGLAAAFGVLAFADPVLAQVDIDRIRTQAEGGDSKALNTLANALVSGDGVEVDTDAAIRAYQQAADRGFAPAAFNLGLIYEIGRGVRTDITRAFQYYLRAAELGFPAAQFNVGNMYARGLGVEVDQFEAVLWFRQAADAGIPDAQFNMAMAYETGVGVSIDPQQAVFWYNAALDKGYVRAAYNLALLYEEARGVEKNDEEAARLYRIAAEQNFAAAQNNLGIMYAEGRGGLPQSLVEAYPWFQLAVENGDDPKARDIVKSRLDRIQQADADVKLSALRNRLGLLGQTSPGRTSATSRNNAAVTSPQNPASTEGSAKMVQVDAEIARLRQENAGLVAANQSLVQEKADLTNLTSDVPVLTGAEAANLAHIKSVIDTLSDLTVPGDQNQRTVRQSVVLLERLADDNRQLNVEVRRATLEISAVGRRLRLMEQGRGAAGAGSESAGLLAAQSALQLAQARVSKLEGELIQSQGLIVGLQNALGAQQREAGDAATLALEIEKRNAAIGQLLASQKRVAVEMSSSIVELAQLRAQVAGLRTELSRAQQSIAASPDSEVMESLNAQLKNRDDELTWLKGRLADADTWSSELTKANGEVLDLQGLLEIANTARAQLETNLQRTMAEAGALQQRLANAEMAASARQIEISSLREQLSTMEVRVAVDEPAAEALRSKVASLESAALKSNEEITSLRKSLEDTEFAIERRDGELANLSNRVSTSQREANQASEAAATAAEVLEATQTQVSRLETAVAQATDRLELAESGGAELAANLVEIETLQAALQATNERRAQFETQVAGLEAVVLRKDSAIAGMQRELKSAQSNAAADIYAETITTARARIAELEQNLAGSNEQVGELRQAVDALESRVVAGAAVAGSLAKAEAEVATLGSSLVQARAQIETMSKRISASESATSALVEEKATLVATIESLESDLLESGSQLAESAQISTSLEIVRIEVQSLEAQLGDTNSITTALREQITQASLANEGLEYANGTLKEDLAQLRMEWEAVSTRASTADKTSRDLSRATARIAELGNSAMSMTAEMAALNKRLGEADTRLNARETELASSFESTQLIQSELGEANRRLVEREQIAEGVAQENSTMREHLQSVAVELAQTAEKLTASRTELISLSKQVESLEESEAQLQRTQQEVIKLELQIVGAQTAWSERETELTGVSEELIAAGDAIQRQEANRFLLESQIATLTEAVTSAQASGAQAKSMGAELETARVRLGEFESTLEAENIENESLRLRVAELDGILDQKESENGAIQGQVVSLTQQLEGTRSKLVGAIVTEGQFAETLVRLEATEIELAASRSKIEGLNTQLKVASESENADAVRLDELRAMAAQLELQLDQRSNELAATWAELDDLRLLPETGFDLDAELKASNEKVTTLTQDLETQNQRVAQRDENLRTLRSQLTATTDTANVREKENRELRDELQTLRDRLVATETSLSKAENLAADLATFQAQVVSLEARLGAAGEGKAAGEARINNLTTEIATKTSVLDALRAQINDTSSQLGAAREKLMLAEQNGSALHTQRQTLQNRLATSEQNLEIATTRKTEIEVELETAREREVELQNLVTEVRDEAGKQRMAAEVQRLSDELGLWRDMAAQRDIELTQAKAALKEENAARADEILNFQTVSSLQLETIEQNETELVQLRSDLSARNDELTTLTAEQNARVVVIETLERQLADASGRLAAAEELETKLLLAETAAAERGSELERLRPRFEKAELDQSELNKSIRILRVRLADAHTETVETQRSASAVAGQLSAKVSDLVRELASTRAAAVEYRKQAEALSETTEEKAAIFGQVAQLERRLAEAEGLVPVLESMTEENQLRQTHLDEISTDLQIARGELAELREQREILIARLDEQTVLIGSLEGNAAAWSERETELSAQIEQLEGVVTKLESDLAASLQNARATESIAVERRELEIGGLRTEIVRLERMVSDFTGAQQALADRQNLVVELQAQLNRARFGAREVDELANEKAGEQIEALTVRLARAETELLDQEDRVALAEAAVEERAQAEVASLRSQLVEAEQQVEALRAQNGEIEQSVTELAQSEIAQLKAQLIAAQAFETELVSTRASMTQNRLVMVELQAEIAAAESRANDAESTATSTVGQELDALRTERAAARAETESLRERMVEVDLLAAQKAEIEITTLNARLTDASSEAETLRVRLAEASPLKEQVADAEESLSQARSHISALEAELQSSQEKIAGFDEEAIGRLQQQNVVLETQVTETRGAVTALEAARFEIERSENLITNLRGQVERLGREKTAEDNAVANGLRLNVDRLTAELTTAQAELVDLANGQEQLLVARETVENLELELQVSQQISKEAEGFAALLTQAELRVRVLETELARRQTDRSQIGALESEIIALRDQIESAAAESAEEIDQRLVELSNELKIARMVETELATTKEALAAARTEVATLIDEARVNLAEADKLRSDNEVTERRIGEVESQLIAANEQLNRLTREVQANASRDSQLQTLRAERSAAETAISEQTQRIATLTDELELARAVKVELGATRQSLEGARGFIAGLETEIATARSGLAGMNSLRTEKETAEQRFQQVQIQLDRANGRVEALIQEVQAQAPLNSQLASVRSERDAAVSAATAISQELDAAEVAINEQTLLIADLTAEKMGLGEDLQASQRVVDAALAAQASAVNAAGTNEALRSQVSNLEAQVRNYEGQMSDDRASTAKEFAALTLQLQRSRETAKSLSEANRALLATREVDAESTDSQVTQLQVEASVLDDQNSSLRAENLALQTALVEAQAAPKAPADWQLQNSALTRELETLARDLRTAETYATTVTELTGVNEQLQVTMAELDSRLANANAREQQAQRREAALEGDLDARGIQLASLEVQLAGVARLPEQVSGLAENLADVRAENLALQTALAEARAAPKPPADWQQRESAMNRQLVTLTRDLAAAQSYATTVDELSGTNSQLQASINEMQSRLAAAGASEQASAQQQARLEREIGDQRQAQSELERQLAGLVSMPTQVVALETAVANARADNQALERALSEARAAPKPTADWQQRESQLVRQVETLAGDLATAESYVTTVNELSGANEQLQAAMGQMQNRLADANSRDDQARSRESALKSEIAEQKEARANVESSLAQWSNLPEQVASMRAAMTEIRGQFEVVSTENMDLKAELSAAAVALNEQQAAVDGAREAERFKLESELTSFTQATSNLTAQLERSRSDLARANAARDGSEIRVATLERQLATTSNLAEQVEELSRRVREAESEIATRRTTSLNLQETLTNERNRLEREIASLSRDNRSLSGRLSQAQTTLDQIASAARVLNPNTNPGGAVSRAGGFSRENSDDGGDNSATDRFHVVREGDSLTRISLRYYGTGSRWQEIYQANRGTLSASNSLQPGQRLLIP